MKNDDGKLHVSRCPGCMHHFKFRTKLYDGLGHTKCSWCGMELSVVYNEGVFVGVIQKSSYSLISLGDLPELAIVYSTVLGYIWKEGGILKYFVPGKPYAVIDKSITVLGRIVEHDKFYKFTPEEITCLPDYTLVEDKSGETWEAKCDKGIMHLLSTYEYKELEIGIDSSMVLKIIHMPIPNISMPHSNRLRIFLD